MDEFAPLPVDPPIDPWALDDAAWAQLQRAIDRVRADLADPDGVISAFESFASSE